MLTPGSWLKLLEDRLEKRKREIQVYQDYYDGKHRLAFATAKFKEAFGSLFAAFADNWCELVVSASVERLKVEGFRFGRERSADDDAWAIWQENGLDAESDSAHTEAVKCGEAYWLVAPPGPGGEVPRITAEHPSQVIVATAAGDRRQRLAALKKWVEPDGYVMATVYLPEAIHKFRSQRPIKQHSFGTRINWERRPDDPGGENPLGVVPVVPLRNKPTMLGGGQSDLKKVVSLQDAVNKLVSDMLVASEYAAYRQRWAAGLEVPTDPETGQPLKSAQLEASLSKLMTSADPETKFGEFAASDLGNYVKAVEMVIQHLSAQTRTPLHYFMGEIVNASGDALKMAETGLVSNVRGKQPHLGEGHEDTMRLAFLAIGDEQRAAATDAETIWRDPESRSFGELIDGLVKLGTIGVPTEVLWERAGFSPQEINRMKTMQLVDQVFAPPPSTAPVPAPGSPTPPPGSAPTAPPPPVPAP